ncbi:MAG: hypothetical protein M0Z64_11720 [Nitrospiraceae bacterium]|nr:hypothetical protein [Nitrospiraceae bacterium]
MLRATIELVPFSVEEDKRDICVIEIANDATGNVEYGNYYVNIYSGSPTTSYDRGTKRDEGRKTAQSFKNCKG